MLHRRALLAAATTAWPLQVRAQAQPIQLCAAAGLQPGLAALDALWRAQGGRALRVQYGSSAAIVRLAEQGSCDLVALADPQRMDSLEQRRLLKPDSRRNLLGNELVLASAADRPVPHRLAATLDLPSLLGDGKLAMPDPAQSAAGRTAREALVALGAWEGLVPRLLLVPEGKAALELVRRGDARLGLAYVTDAFAVNGIRVALSFPAESHAPIVYPFALTRRADLAAAELLAFLAGPDAAAVWRSHGFALR